jgi:hypothetical protein
VRTLSTQITADVAEPIKVQVTRAKDQNLLGRIRVFQIAVDGGSLTAPQSAVARHQVIDHVANHLRDEVENASVGGPRLCKGAVSPPPTHRMARPG